MKRLLSFAVCLLTALLSYAHDFEVDGIYYKITSSSEPYAVDVTYRGEYDDSYSEYTGTVTIPESVTYAGTTYSVTSIGSSAFDGCSSLTSVTIPNSVTSIGSYAFNGCHNLRSVTIGNSVTTIGRYAFWFCSGLTSVTIPNSVTSIGDEAFSDCRGLTSVTIPNSVTSIGLLAFRNCSGLTSVTIPNSVTSIGYRAFYGCTGLTSVTIPNSVTSIDRDSFEGTAWYNNQPNGLVYAGKVAYKYKGTMPANTSITLDDGTLGIAGGAFEDCSGLTSVTIPNSVTNIGSYAFRGCSGLTSVTIPNSVTSIGDDAFLYCSGLTSVTIPNSVTSIGSYAFKNCSGLTSVTIPNSVVSIGGSAFYGCNITSLLVLARSSVFKKDTFAGLSISSVIYAQDYNIAYIKQSFKGTIVAIDLAEFDVDVPKIYYKGVDINLNTDNRRTIKSAKVEVNGQEVMPNSEGLYEVRGLKSGTAYNIKVDIQTSMTVNGEEFTAQGMSTKDGKTIDLGFQNPKCSYTASQTGLTINTINAKTDQTAIIKEVGFSYDGNHYTVGSNPIQLNNLFPKTDYPLELYAIYSDGETIYETVTCRTASLLPYITMTELTPTTFKCSGSYTAEDAIVTGTEYVGYNPGNTLHLKELTPNKTYSIKYRVLTENGGSETTSYSFTTPTPTFKSLPAKTVNAGEVIVAAETNLVDEVVSVGFEWRKTSAPSDLPSSSGAGAIFQGKLEAKIKNLSTISDVYYRVRPYYEYANGYRTYGDWMAFDPTEVSYCEPVIHTYDNPEVSENGARLIGYVMAGSDDILEQGFEYWQIGTNLARGEGNVVTALNIQKVVSSGQRMSANISGLKIGATYKYRAYVKTNKGTIYGEEQEFRMTNVTGIESVYNDEQRGGEVYEVARYNMHGRRISTPERGINIVKMSNGTTRKIAIK